MSDERIQNFKEFYPFYLKEHTDKINRILHFIGTSILIVFIIYMVITKQYNMLWFSPLIGYSFAWIGHFVFEKNRPATFKHPLWSLISDFKMWFELLTRKLYF